MEGYLSHTQWLNFFKKVGLSVDVAADYAVKFGNNRIQINMLPDISKENLREMGIKPMADIIYILQSAKKGYHQVMKERATISPNKITVPQWMKIFTKALLPEPFVNKYANIFSENKIDMHTLKGLSDEHLKDMGIDVLGDRMVILRCANSLLTGKKAARSYMNVGPNKMNLMRKKKNISVQCAPIKQIKSTLQYKKKGITETTMNLKETGTNEIEIVCVEQDDMVHQHISKKDSACIKSENREELPTTFQGILKRKNHKNDINSYFSVKTEPSSNPTDFCMPYNEPTLSPNVYTSITTPGNHSPVAESKQTAQIQSTSGRNTLLINPVTASGSHGFLAKSKRTAPPLQSTVGRNSPLINPGVSHMKSMASLMRTGDTVEHQDFIDGLNTLFPPHNLPLKVTSNMGKANNRPRGRMSAYAFFVQNCRKEHKKQHPDETIHFAVFSKCCSELWKTMSQKQKQNFYQMAEIDKKRYESQMVNYKPPNTAASSKKKCTKDPNAPKRGLCAFFWFASHERPKVKELMPGATVGDIAKELARRWNNVTLETKGKYETLAAKDRARYEEEMMAYDGKKAK